MTIFGALDNAIDLYRNPARLREFQSGPLPADVADLLSIKVDDTAAALALSRTKSGSRKELEEIAGFYIEQVLLCNDSDYYRILGATESATREELRANMGLLLRWLHPDQNGNEDRSVFATRVINAWKILGSADLRDGYDRIRRNAMNGKRNGKPLENGQKRRSRSAIPEKRRDAKRTRQTFAPRRAPLQMSLRRRKRTGLASASLRYLRRFVLLALILVIIAYLIQPEEMMQMTQLAWQDILQRWRNWGGLHF